MDKAKPYIIKGIDNQIICSENCSTFTINPGNQSISVKLELTKSFI